MHQAGQLPDAEAAYRRVLGLDGGHADANHLLGVIAHQIGDHGAAVELIGKAIRHNPSTATYHRNLGNALHELDRLDEAEASQHLDLAGQAASGPWAPRQIRPRPEALA